MDIEKLRCKLMAAARANPPGDEVPYAFEKRIMARLETSPLSPSQFSAIILWRAVFACMVIMVLTCGWDQVSKRVADSSEPFAMVLEDAVLALLDFDGEAL